MPVSASVKKHGICGGTCTAMLLHSKSVSTKSKCLSEHLLLGQHIHMDLPCLTEAKV